MDRNFSNLGDSGVFETVYANVAYASSETPAPGSTVTGYTAGSWSCTGGIAGKVRP